MEINVLVNGAYRENCYILSANGQAVVIDAGVDANAIKSFLSENNLKLQMILITHAHFDHCQCVGEFDVPIYISKTDYVLAQKSDNIPSFFGCYFEDERLFFDGKEFEIIPTPGHTKGSVCILYDGLLFTGDTLFEGAVGRTDLPTGDFDQLKESLKMLCERFDDIQILAGHGQSTLLNKERKFIEYLLRH